MSDYIEHASEIVHGAMFGLTTPAMVRAIVSDLDSNGLLATPAHDAAVLREAMASMEDEDGREWPFNGLDEMLRWLGERADAIEREGGVS